MTASQEARRMWTLFEPVHDVTYFAAEARTAFESAGLRGFWRGYFAGRSAPLGPVAAAPVTASFYTFAPAMVSRAVPGVWDLVSPAEALRARQAGAVAALKRILADQLDAVGQVADRLAAALAGLDCAGRVLAGANAELPVPDEPVARLWHAATVLREHRGDGHFAALVAADVDGCESIVLRAGIDLPREILQPIRGWTDEQWNAAAGRLAARGLLGGDGKATADGVALREFVEQATDVAAARPWHDEDLAAGLADALRPLARACWAELPALNPVGLPGLDTTGGSGASSSRAGTGGSSRGASPRHEGVRP
jgi:helix-turn-helix protein